MKKNIEISLKYNRSMYVDKNQIFQGGYKITQKLNQLFSINIQKQNQVFLNKINFIVYFIKYGIINA